MLKIGIDFSKKRGEKSATTFFQKLIHLGKPAIKPKVKPVQWGEAKKKSFLKFANLQIGNPQVDFNFNK